MSTKHKHIKEVAETISRTIQSNSEKYFSSDTAETKSYADWATTIKKDFTFINQNKSVVNKIVGLVYNHLRQKKQSIFQTYVAKLKKKKRKKNFFFDAVIRREDEELPLAAQ